MFIVQKVELQIVKSVYKNLLSLKVKQELSADRQQACDPRMKDKKKKKKIHNYIAFQ